MRGVTTQTIRAERLGPTIRLSPIDVLLRNVAVPVVFFYDERIDEKALASSLAEALAHFPLFAGSLAIERGVALLSCDDRGVPVSVVERHETRAEAMAGILGREPRRLIDVLDAAASMSGRGPLLTVRVTHFRGGTSALGLCWHHPVGDMASFMCFVRSWASAFAGRGVEAPLIVDDRLAYFRDHVPEREGLRPGIRRLRASELGRLAAYLALEAWRKQPIAFYFSDEEVLALRDALQKQAGLRLSANDAICAHMATLIGELDPRVRSRVLAVVVNWRSRVGLPLNLLGNLVGALYVDCEPKVEAAIVAGRLRRAIDQAAERHMNLHATCRAFSEGGGTQAAWRMVPRGLDPVAGNLLVTNWSGFGVYDIAFGGGRPSLFLAVGRTPFPWLSGLVEGMGSRGSIYFATLPSAIARALRSASMAPRVHPHRRGGSAPDGASELPWLS